MTPATTAMRQALRVRIALLLKDLRTSNRPMLWGRYDGNGCSVYRSEFRPKEDGYLEVTGPIVADKVEAGADALVEATAVDLELMLAELVPAEFHAVALADAKLIERWPWSEQTEAGQWVLLWGGGTVAPLLTWPDDVTQEEVAAWMLPALMRRDHPIVRMKEPQPGLFAPIFDHPKTGGRWVWWQEAMVTLYLANPVTVAARCVRALERLDTKKIEDAHLSTARKALEETDVDADTMARGVGDLADELCKRMGDARALLDADAALESIRNPSGPMLPWDEKAAAFYEGLSTGHAHGTAVADALREAARTRWADGTGLFRLWTPQPPHNVPQFALTLAKVLWKDVVKPRMGAPDFAVRLVAGAADYAKLPKVTAGLSWAIGAPGVTLGRVTLDGDEYALEPSVAANALVPRAYGAGSLLPLEYLRKPHQAALPIQHDEDDEPVFAVTVADATQYAMSPMAGKVALLVLAAAVETSGKLARIKLGELTRRVNPDAKRILQSHHATVTSALKQLRTLWLYLPDGRKVQCFDVPVLPQTAQLATADMEVFMGLHPVFQALLSSGIPVPGKDRSPFKGAFLINLTGAMALPTKRPGLLRQYVRAAAVWNAAWKPGSKGEPDPTRIMPVSVDRWAAMTNSLSPAAVEYLRATGQQRKALSARRKGAAKERKEMLAELDELEALGLVVVEKAGKDTLKLLPPKAYLEAKSQARKAGTRPETKEDD